MSRIRDVSYGGTGFLQVAVYAQDVGMPVNSANIRISPKGERTNIIMDLITDSSGQTPTVDLPAPPVELSLGAQPQTRPYSEYDLIIQADGFDTALVEGVQILPDADALQDVYLCPAVSDDAVDIIPVEEHALYGDYPKKTPEDDVKDMPPELDFSVLPEPEIPQYMIVHTGTPSNASAPDYWIPFKDYIKNVASCQIYDTWPEETIRAIVLAIISFALNRVYTEWYKNKGYEFTITNSTSYDQAFVYGRNVYSRISRIVDDIFTSYITKPGIRQPLMTLYCDGRRIQTPNWMTLWGAKALGERGYAAIDILKSFYGQEIYLMQAKSIQGVVRPFGDVLREGSQGHDVSTIQTQLNEISNNFPAIPKICVDGDFNQATREAIQKFQMIFKLRPDGIVGPATWYRLSDIFTAVERFT